MYNIIIRHLVNQQVLGLEVSVEDVLAVTKGESSQQLVPAEESRAVAMKNRRLLEGGKNAYKKDLTMSKSISPLRLSKYFLRSWSQCSKTRVNFLSLCRTSYRRTIFLCLSSFRRQISLSAEDGTPYRSKLPDKSCFFFLNFHPSGGKQIFIAS